MDSIFVKFHRSSHSFAPHCPSQVQADYTEDSSFDPEKVSKGSVAAAGLCKWVHAMVVYHRVAKVVAPKRAALAEAESALTHALSELTKKQEMLKVNCIE